MSAEGGGLSDFAPRELLLAAAARAVLEALRGADAPALPGPADAALHVLESALAPYGPDKYPLPAPPPRR